MRSLLKPVAFMALFVMFFAFANVQSVSAESGGDIEGILRRSKLVVAVTAVDQPPR